MNDCIYYYGNVNNRALDNRCFKEMSGDKERVFVTIKWKCVI